MCLWDVEGAIGSATGGHTGLVPGCAFTRNGTALLTASVDGTVRCWETATGKETGPAVAYPGHALPLLPSGDDVVLAAGEQGAALLVADPLAPASRADSYERSEPTPVPVNIGEHGAQVWGLALLPRGDVVTGGQDGRCRVWDVGLRAEILCYPGDGAAVHTCATAADGSFVASAGDAGRLHLWDPTSGEALLVTKVHTAGIRAITVGPHGDVVTGGADGPIMLTDPTSRRQPRLLGHGAHITSALWVNPSGVVTCDANGTLALWPTDGTDRGWHRQAHQGRARYLAASHAGTVLATGGADGMLALWESTTGRALARLPCTGQVHGVAVHPHEPVVAAVGDGGLVCIAEMIDLDVP